MSEKELLDALEEDTKRECKSILENAEKEADAVVKETIEKMEKIKKEEIEKAKTSMELERIKRLADARLYAKRIILEQRQTAVKRVLDMVDAKIYEMRNNRDYPHILKNLLKEALDKWHALKGNEKPLVLVSKQDIDHLNDITGCRVIPDEKGDISVGVAITDKDRRFRIINTLHSRLEKTKPEIVSMIDRALFGKGI